MTEAPYQVSNLEAHFLLKNEIIILDCNTPGPMGEHDVLVAILINIYLTSYFANTSTKYVTCCMTEVTVLMTQ